MSFPTYPAYKDSGVEWLGDVPEHWYSARFSRVVMAIKDGTHGTFERVDEGVPLLSAKNVQNGFLDINEGESLISEDDSRSIVSNGFPSAGDLLLTIVGTIGRSCVYTADKPYAFQRSVCFLRFYKRYSSYFFYYFSQSKFFQEQLAGRSKSSAQAGVYMGDVVATSVVFPPDFSEQTQIARFLDHETARIDALIKEQQRLIELLKEKRQAVISHAVTKGLDPTVPMKDSGVEWLGEVPAHWDVMALKWRARIKSGDGISPSLIEAELSTQNSIPVIGGNGVMGYTSQGNITPPLIVIGRVGALCGNVHKIYEPAWVSDNALVLEVQRESLDLAYLAHVLNARNLNQIADKSAQPLITGSKVTSQCLPCPCLDEQLAIAAFVDSVLAEFDELTSAGEEGIELLKERRSALISAAVTGKIDVRGWQPPASAQAPESAVAEAV